MKESLKHDHFLADAIKPRPSNSSSIRLSYLDGFRFGVGFFIGSLLMLVILAGLTWGIIAALGLH